MRKKNSDCFGVFLKDVNTAAEISFNSFVHQLTHNMKLFGFMGDVMTIHVKTGNQRRLIDWSLNKMKQITATKQNCSQGPQSYDRCKKINFTQFHIKNKRPHYSYSCTPQMAIASNWSYKTTRNAGQGSLQITPLFPLASSMVRFSPFQLYRPYLKSVTSLCRVAASGKQRFDFGKAETGNGTAERSYSGHNSPFD